MNALAAWSLLIASVAPAFTAPSAGIFADLTMGWVLSPGRRTITRMICAADPEGRRAHDAYHRFVRKGAWSMAALWRTICLRAVAQCRPGGVVCLDLDDTLYNKTGRHVDGAGIFRDAVRSTARYVVHSLGLNVVVLTLRVTAPWGGQPIGLPVNVRLHRKGGPTPAESAAEMIAELAGWLPGRRFALAADGAYACLAGAELPRCSLTSRMRRDAALFEAAPPRTGRRGRPRKRGQRLATPVGIAQSGVGWAQVTVNLRGRDVERLVLIKDVLWYRVNKDNLVRLVIVRDPEGDEPDDFLFSTDLTAAGADVASAYAGRWCIEVCFRDTKQHLGGEDPQCWKGQGPERAAALSLWLTTAVWLWYIEVWGTERTWVEWPWYRSKVTPSFADALAALRRTLWTHRITAASFAPEVGQKITDALVEILASAA